MHNLDKDEVLQMIGQGLLYASVLVSLGSCEMSSKYSVRNFSKDQQTLQSASDALSDFVLISTFWSIGVCLLMYAQYGVWGLITGLLSNILIILWLVLSYQSTFKEAAKTYNLKMPKFKLFQWNLAK